MTVIQNIAFDGKECESNIAYEESFQMDQLKNAFDVFQRELLNIQCWVEIAESRARIIPQGNDEFECFHCGWVTDIWTDDIICPGCGKRYWSEMLYLPDISA
jgi:Zn finger protein HypA/HybF involved in hydrogenase expression